MYHSASKLNVYGQFWASEWWSECVGNSYQTVFCVPVIRGWTVVCFVASKLGWAAAVALLWCALGCCCCCCRSKRWFNVWISHSDRETNVVVVVVKQMTVGGGGSAQRFLGNGSPEKMGANCGKCKLKSPWFCIELKGWLPAVVTHFWDGGGVYGGGRQRQWQRGELKIEPSSWMAPVLSYIKSIIGR